MASTRTRSPRAGESAAQKREVRCDDCGAIVLTHDLPFRGEGLPEGISTEDAYTLDVLERHARLSHVPAEPLEIQPEAADAWTELR